MMKMSWKILVGLLELFFNGFLSCSWMFSWWHTYVSKKKKKGWWHTYVSCVQLGPTGSLLLVQCGPDKTSRAWLGFWDFVGGIDRHLVSTSTHRRLPSPPTSCARATFLELRRLPAPSSLSTTALDRSLPVQIGLVNPLPSRLNYGHTWLSCLMKG